MPHVSIAIDSEFQSLIPPLSDDEYERLEKSILAEGVRDPIITWNGTIIDGHNRYNICDEHGIPFKTVEREFASRDAAKIWIIENQFGRRNLSKYDRSVLALQLEPLYAAEAKRRALDGNSRGGKSSQKSDATSDDSEEGGKSYHLRTDEQLAKLAGTSRDTIRKVKVIETEAAKGNETAIEARDAVKSGEKSIHKAYTEVRPKADKADSRPLCVICGEPIDEGDAYDHNTFKHKKCAVIDTETHRGAKGGRPPTGKFAKAQFTENGRRICSVCGKPIDDGDFYEQHPTTHKKCHTFRSNYADSSLLNNVPTYTVESLLMELQASADNLKEAWEESVSINESMGVSLTSVQKKKINMAVTNLFKTIQKIREEADNG